MALMIRPQEREHGNHLLVVHTELHAELPASPMLCEQQDAVQCRRVLRIRPEPARAHLPKPPDDKVEDPMSQHTDEYVINNFISI